MISNIFLAIILCLFISQLHMTKQDGCTSLNNTISITIIATKHPSGHYLTEWIFNKESTELAEKMRIDLKSTTTECRGVKKLQLLASIKGIFNGYGTEPTISHAVPSDYEFFPGIGYYKFYPNGADNFDNASSVCIKDGGHLAILNSEAEYNTLKNIYTKYPSAYPFAYVGFNDLQEEGKYVTVLGDPLVTTGFARWKAYEPNGGTTENCGSVHRTDGLNDFPCDGGPWPFFCEYDL